MYWKNKPIDCLSETELREALRYSVDRLLQNPDNFNDHSVVISFASGFISSLLLAAVVLMLV